MTQRELITHFINRLRFRWNRAVSTATWHPTNFCLTPTPTRLFVRARTVASYTDKYIARTPACMLFFHFFFCLYLHSLSLSCRCFISQLGEYLNVIMTFAIKSKQRGWIEERMPDLPLSTLRVPLHVECFFDCSGFFFFLLSQMDGVFLIFMDRFIDTSTCCEAQQAHVVSFLNGKPLSLSLYIYNTTTLPSVCASMKTTSYLLANSIPFAKRIGRRHK